MAWIFSHVDFSEAQCLPWPFARNAAGYGKVFFQGKNAFVNRVMCEFAHGPAPTPEHEAAHSCGKGHEGCANPNHLRWATPKDNVKDRDQHGTEVHGERVWSAKITADDASAIRRRAGGGETHAALAAEFGLHRKYIWQITSGRKWARA